MSQQDRPHRTIEREPLAEDATRADEPQERGAHHDRRQHERHRHRGTEDALATEREPGEHIGARERERQRQQRRRRRLPHREPDHSTGDGITEHVTDGAEVPLAVGPQPAHDDARHRPHEEHPEEHGRDGGQRHDAESPTPHHPRTVDVQSLIHRSRLRPIVSMSTSIGFAGFTANFVNTSGNAASTRTGYTNICNGMSSWNGFDNMKSMNWWAASACDVPFSTPTNSTCLKQLSSTTPTAVVSFGGCAKATSAGGLVAYESTTVRVPVPALPIVNSLLYA